MNTSSSAIDWEATAAVYRDRLHALAFWAAFVALLGAGLLLARLLNWMQLDSAWVETVSMLLTLPAVGLLFLVKNKLEDLSDRGLPIHKHREQGGIH